MKKKRRKYTPEEKVAILKRHLVDKDPVRVSTVAMVFAACLEGP